MRVDLLPPLNRSLSEHPQHPAPLPSPLQRPGGGLRQATLPTTFVPRGPRIRRRSTARLGSGDVARRRRRRMSR